MIARKYLRIVLCAALSCLGTYSAPTFAQLEAGELHIVMDGTDSELRRFDTDGVTPIGLDELLDQGAQCLLGPTSRLLSFSTPAGSVGGKFDAIGVKLINGNGTGCSAIDQKGSTREQLDIALGTEVDHLSIRRADLHLELKGTDIDIAIEFFESATDPTPEVYRILGGDAAVGVVGRAPEDFLDPNHDIICFTTSESNPDSVNTCDVRIRDFAHIISVRADEGSASLEAGAPGSLPGPSILYLTTAQGQLDCGDVITAELTNSVGIGQCRRLENLVGCEACVEIPYQFDITTTATEVAFDLIVEKGFQCPAFQCLIEFDPGNMLNFLDGASRVTGAQQAANPLPTAQDEFPLKNQPFTNQVPFPLSGEFADLPQTKIQFDTVTPDPKYYVLPCLETPDFHQEVELAAGAGMFVVGETISKVGPAASGIVLGYSIVDGQPVIAYELVSGAGFGPGDVISGATSMAAGTVSSVERDSAFLQELVGSVMNPAGAGYVFPDQSPVNLSNNQGIQYGCSLGREIRIPFKDTFQVIEDMYIQGDVRGSIRR